MMKQKTILVVCFFISSLAVFSQTKKSVSAFGGYSEDGFATSVNVQLYPEDIYLNFFELSFYAGFLKETESEYEIPLDIYTVNAGYHFRINPLSSNSNRFISSLGFGGIIGSEKLNDGSKDLPNGALIKSKDGLIYGGYGAFEVDVYLSDSFSLVGRYTYFYHANSDIQPTKFMVGAGIKYTIK